MFNLEIIISEVYDDDAIPTLKALILQIQDRKELTKIIQILSEKLPLKSLSLDHLKRIDSKNKVCQILIGPISESLNNSKNEDIIQQTLNLMDNDLKQFLLQYGLDKFKIHQIPKSAPLTKNQLKKISPLWPVNFHENKYIAECLSGNLFSKDRLERINELMNETLNLLTIKDKIGNNSDKKNKKYCSATIITKNDGKQIVTKTISRIEQHPLHHAVIIAVSNVAQLHLKYKSSSSKDLEPNLIEQYKDDYLCTNYECFLSQEPCIMCAMALVHSRIKRVFFYSPTSLEDSNSFNQKPDPECNDHAFTTHRLHVNPNLNHRYEVWKLTKATTKESEFPNKKLKS